MPVLSSEIQMFLSGGASNTVPNSSTGGVRSSQQVVNATLENLFDNVSGAEASAGLTEYRGVFIRNTNASITLETAKIWVQTVTPSIHTEIAIVLDSAATGATATMSGGTPLANTTTAPTTITGSFGTPTSEATAVVIGNIPAGQQKGVWLRRIVTAGATAFPSDGAVLRVQGDTA
jgi:hypothetical protein